MTKRTKKIPRKKLKEVSELAELVKSKKTIVIASIKNIPASQYQEIVKMLRRKAVVKVPKKSIIFRALDVSGNEAIKKLKEHIKESSAILFSDIDAFDLSADLVNEKISAKAKSGQEAPEDIVVQAGPTDLVPGPAISELGALGIQIQIERGKINIKEPRVIVKKGKKISAAAADLMGKLGMKPFTIGFIPLAAFDIKEGKLYLEINIDKEGITNNLKEAFSKALPFAVEIGYATQDTIKFIIGKAGMNRKALEKIIEADKGSESETKEKKEDEEEVKEKEGNAEEKTKEPEKTEKDVNKVEAQVNKDIKSNKEQSQEDKKEIKNQNTQQDKQNLEDK